MRAPAGIHTEKILSWFARGITIVFYPVFLLPAVLLVLYGWSAEVIPLHIITFICLTVLPLLLSFWYFHRLGVADIYLIAQKHRLVPFLFNFLTLGLYALLLTIFQIDLLPLSYVFAFFLINAGALLITVWDKISLHMMGLGSVAGFAAAMGHSPEQWLGMGWESMVEHLPEMGLGGLIALALAWARWHLKSHNPRQLLMGLGIGYLWMKGMVMVMA